MSTPRQLSPGGLALVRGGLLLAAFGWGISFAFAFAPWDLASAQLMGMGARDLHYQPILDYWMRMAGATFGSIGLAAALACWRPGRFAVLVKLFPPFHLFIGIVLSVAALRNDLHPTSHPSFLMDIAFCFLVAALIQIPLWLDRSAGPE